jgi:uncharacterized repeat protein (TIGR02543 family)
VPGYVNQTPGGVGVILLHIPYGTSPASLTPRIGWAGKTISPGESAAQNFGFPVAYTVTAEDGVTTKQYLVSVSVSGPGDNEILEFSFKDANGVDTGYSGVIQESFPGTQAVPKTVTVFVPSLADLNLQAVITHNGKEVLHAGGTLGGASTIVDGTRDFANLLNYTVVAENGERAVYKVTVTRVAGFTVTFDENGGDAPVSPASMIVTPPATTLGSLPAPPTKAMVGVTTYTFAGWNTQQGGGFATVFNEHTPVTGSIDVYAQWAAGGPGDVTVGFDAQGGVVDPIVEIVPSGKSLDEAGKTLPTPPPTRAGHTFAGWFTQPISGGAAFDENYPVPAAMTVYARWTPAPVIDGQPQGRDYG